MEQLPDVDEIYVPIGGGGLAAGIITAIKEKKSHVRIIGVESSMFPAMKSSIEAGEVKTIQGGLTIAAVSYTHLTLPTKA